MLKGELFLVMYIYIYIVEHKVCSAPSKPTQSSSRRVSLSPSNHQHTACGEDRKYISEHKQNAHNDGNRAQPLKRLFETLFLAIKKCTGFTTDVIQWNTKCAVSLAKYIYIFIQREIYIYENERLTDSQIDSVSLPPNQKMICMKSYLKS